MTRAIEQLKQAMEVCELGALSLPDQIDALMDAGKAVLQEVSALTHPNEWISVEERLPGVSGNYICAVKDKNGSVWTIPAEWSLEMKMWIGAFGEIKNIVTHWMPLPAPPDRRPPEGEEET